MMRTLLNQKREKRANLRLILVSLALLPAISGCGQFVPKTASLKNIHQSYRAEFQKFLQLSLPAPPSDGETNNLQGAPKGAAEQPAFAETLREIREYRLKYGEASKEAAHLTVLEGMIYLQSGQLGMARLRLPDINEAKEKLGSETGKSPRDQLLADNFEALINGWSAIKGPGVLDDARKLAGAADSIKDNLQKLNGAKRAQPEVDEGAIYIATSGAIFYAWVGKILSFQPGSDKSCWCRKGRDLIAPYLTDSEKKVSQEVDFQNVASGRIRYISWYGALKKCGETQNEAANCQVP